MTVISGARVEIGIDESAYPEALRGIDRAPERLYVIGDASALSSPSLAIAGARRATPYGIACAARFAAMAAGRGICTVTGGALGVDGAATRAALDAGGTCVVVLAHGLDVDAYPHANAGLFQEVVDAGGAIVSERPRDAPPLPWAFRARNRIVTGLAACLIVCETGVPSGTLSAADDALAQGKAVLAVPGRIDEPSSTGPNVLIAVGAKPIVSDASLEAALIEVGL